MNRRFQAQGYEMGLEAGVNEVPVPAVNNDERLDSFGQNVNVAARVQNLAQDGELWLTEPVCSGLVVTDALAAHTYRSTKQSALLRGVAEPVVVYQCVPV